MQCTKCNNDHFVSYAFNKETKAKHYYKDAHLNKYLQISQETIFEIELLQDLIASIVFNHTSFWGFSKFFNYRYALNISARDRLNSKRLAEAFFIYHLCIYYAEADLNLKSTSIPLTFVIILIFPVF